MRKVKRKKAKMLIFSIILCGTCLIAYTASSIYLKQYNNQLSVNIQVTEAKISSLSTEKEALQVEIDKLATKTKVVDAVDSDEMTQNNENIIYIDGEE